MWQITLTASAQMEAPLVDLLERQFSLPVAGYFEARTGNFSASVYADKLSASPAAVHARLRQALKHLPPLPEGRAPRVRDIFAKNSQGLGDLLPPDKVRRPPATRPRVRLTIKKLPRQNWAESWKRHFKPLEIGRHLLIKPGWSKKKPRPGQKIILLDPGLSFGTGHHPTTEYCLTQLAALLSSAPEPSFLDIGTGSGILAIAAAKLGYRHIDAFDFDPISVRVARQNARRNRVPHRLHFTQSDLVKMKKTGLRRYGVVCANLIANLLTDQAEKIIQRVQPGGYLVVAGILRREFQQISDILVNIGLTPVDNVLNREWQSGTYLRLPIGNEKRSVTARG